MKCMMVSRIDDEKAIEYTGKLGDALCRGGIDVEFETATAHGLHREGSTLSKARPDMAVIVGGDGTILRTVQAMDRQVPVIGINWGEVGFLADLEPEEAEGVLTTISDGFLVEPRMRLSFFVGDSHIGDALNEVLIVTSRPAKMLRFGVIIDGILSERFRADGLLVSTPTGSTAYAMSAGGPIIDPRIEGALLVPLAPYMLSSRPHFISGDRPLEIRLESAKPASLVIDGQKSMDLGCEAAIRVKKSTTPALFVDVGRNFFAKVDQKLRRL
ncbi:MAG TPA: NAD(+)/NADH kinase [Methanoregulaceae archaeon]|nr:NAD(+)/NADH kinase [Methanoregulaceae archaeon]HPW10116.1 NAD(+)/NADH kinase [Methanoregulaceae archaeon]